MLTNIIAIPNNLKSNQRNEKTKHKKATFDNNVSTLNWIGPNL